MIENHGSGTQIRAASQLSGTLNVTELLEGASQLSWFIQGEASYVKVNYEHTQLENLLPVCQCRERIAVPCKIWYRKTSIQ